MDNWDGFNLDYEFDDTISDEVETYTDHYDDCELSISEDELYELIQANRELYALEVNGVKDCEGYEEAMEMV